VHLPAPPIGRLHDPDCDRVPAWTEGDHVGLAPGDPALRLVLADPFSARRVEDGHGTPAIADRECASIGTERDGAEVFAAGLQDPEHGGVTQQRREKVGASRH
jgi:hypothetical protein